MDARTLSDGVTGAWQQIVGVDELLDAVERDDMAAARTLALHPSVRAALESDSQIRMEVLSCMAVSGSPELEEEAISIIQREPGLVRTRFGGGQTLLHRAAAAWSVSFAERLLALGADPDARDIAGHPPLYHAGNRFPRPTGLPEGVEQAFVAAFHKYSADMDRAEGVKLSTPLHMAARRGHAGLAAALVAHGADMEARDRNGETPLRRAVNCGQPAVVRVLLSLGADARSLCKRGRTPRDAARSVEMQRLFDG